MRAWVAPLVAGLVAAVAVAGLGPRLIDTRPPPPEPWELAARAGHVWPFPSACGESASFLLVAPQGRARAGLPDVHLSWISDRLAIRNATFDPAASLGPWPRVAPCAKGSSDGGLRLTAYVFLLDGSLLASNDAAAQRERFRASDSFVELPAEAWNATGTLPPAWQSVLEPALLRLSGLPTGGVVTAVVAAHPAVEQVGPLVVTARVDARSAAPP